MGLIRWMNGECEAIEEDEWNAVGLMIWKVTYLYQCHSG